MTRPAAILVHPPFADPTQPYVSLPTLKGALRARAIDVRVVDLNIEAAHWLLAPDTLEALARRVAERFAALDRTGSLSFEEQREYVRLADARRLCEQLLAADPSPLEVFRSERLFFDPVQYGWATKRVDALFDVLAAACFPFRFGFNQATHSVVPWSFDLLADYVRQGRSPLAPLYRRWVEDVDADFVGISVVFPCQIPEALALAHAVRERRPGTFVMLGGPCLHQIAIHLEPALQPRLFDFADAIGLFEGEETLARLLPGLPDTSFERLRHIPNLMCLDPSGAPHIGPRHVLDLRTSPPPDYSDLDLDRYLAPSRTLLYAPTRGCYWGQCSFCYYGLAETATASYREVPPAVAATQLGELTARHGVRHVYLSCDVLSPSYALRLAQALIDQGVELTWSSDLKIERHFTPERCELLFRSGLRAAAFGIESGSDRILELIRKGTDRATMTAVNRAFHDAGVATEWMTFTDHPDETVDEALETAAWIAEEQGAIDLFIVGRFGLERGSHIAQDPKRYGVESIYHAAGDELRLYALFTQSAGPRSPEDAPRVDDAVAAVGAAYALHPYPWAGANSTHHTLLHFVRLGQRAFRTHFQAAGELGDTLPRAPAVSWLRGKPRYDVEALRAAEAAFMERYLGRALYTTLPGENAALAPLCLTDFAQAARGAPVAVPGRRRGGLAPT